MKMKKLEKPPKKGRSTPVWTYFEKSDNGSKIATCIYCRRELSYKTTITNLKAHLRQKHNSAYNILMNLDKHYESPPPAIETVTLQLISNEDETMHVMNVNEDRQACESIIDGSEITTQSNNLAINNVDFEPTKKVQRVSQTLPKKIKCEDKKKLDLCLLKMAVYDFQPFSIVEEEGFREFTHALNPTYEIPDRNTLSVNILSNVYENRLEQLKSYVEEVAKSICISIDCWKSRNMENYMGITAHFNVDDSMKSIFIQCAEFESHDTGFRMFNRIKTMLVKWNIYHRVNFFVTDNVPNMESTIEFFESDGWSHFGCLAQKLNRIIQDALQDINETLMNVEIIVSYFKKSTIAKQSLLKYQKCQQNGCQPKTVIKSVPTSWTSVYLMLQRFVELKEALRTTMLNFETGLPDVSVEDWQRIEQICVILKPFYDATNEISAENYLTASKAMVLTSSLTSICQNYCQMQYLCTPVKKLSQKLEIGMKKIFEDMEMNMKISLSTVLDPRFKLKAFKTEEHKQNVKTTLLSKMEQVINNNQQTTIKNIVVYLPNTTTSSASPTTKVNIEYTIPSFNLWNEFDSESEFSNSTRPSQEKAAEELERYLTSFLIKRTECPFKWWQEHKQIYPNLYEIFAQHSNIVVTSVPWDRLYSMTGNIMHERRSRLSSTKVSQVMFLNVNKI